MEAIFQKTIIRSKFAEKLFGAAAFMVVTALSAYVRIPLPFTPVPVTLQTLSVLLAGLYLGAGFGAASQAGYLLLGIMGLPVFSSSAIGLNYLFGPTGGYLVGFVAAAGCMGFVNRNARSSVLKIVLQVLVAELVIFALGTLWLKFFLHVSITQSLMLGLIPFVPGEIFKMFAAVTIYSLHTPCHKGLASARLLR